MSLHFHAQCYSIITEPKLTWNNARIRCQSMGGNLVTISSRDVEGSFHFFFTGGIL